MEAKPVQMSKKQLHSVVVRRRKRLDQVTNVGQFCFVISISWKNSRTKTSRLSKHELKVGTSRSRSLLTDGRDEVVEVAEREQRVWKLPEKQLQCSGDDVDVLPLTVLEVQLLCSDTKQASALSRGRRRRKRSLFYRDRPWSEASGWQRGSRSLCRVHQCLNLQINMNSLQPAALRRTENKRSSFSFDGSRSPRFSTALIHFSTKPGTVVFSWAHRWARWQPNTVSAQNKAIIIHSWGIFVTNKCLNKTRVRKPEKNTEQVSSLPVISQVIFLPHLF